MYKPCSVQAIRNQAVPGALLPRTGLGVAGSKARLKFYSSARRETEHFTFLTVY